MKVKSIIAALLLLVAGLQTAQAQKMVVTMTDNQVVKYNLNKVKDVTFEEGTPIGTTEYVDLGLPSGTMWATTNIGASDPEEVGDFYAWGETETKDTYSWATYQLCNGSYLAMNKYCTDEYYGTVDGLKALEDDDDVATTLFGEEWSIPTQEQFEELVNETYTTCNRTTQNGVEGLKVTSQTTGKSIFLPICGYLDGTSSYDENRGYYWMKDLYVGIDNLARSFSVEVNGYSVWDSKNRRCGLNIRPVCKPKAYVTSIVLSETTLAMQQDEIKMLTATVLPDNAENKAVTWKSSNDNVAEVNQNGRILANGVGSCVITCSATDGSGVKAECQVTVAKAGAVTEIVLSETVLILLPDEMKTLTATVLPDNADNKAVAWESSDVNVAEVNQNGRVLANGVGSCVITCSATDGSGVKAECQVTVTNTILVKSIVLSETVLSMKPDEIKTLTATVLPDNAENKALAWKSSDSNVASVNQNGRVVSNSHGTCTITCSATDGSGVYAECKVTVTYGDIGSLCPDENHPHVIDLGLPSGTKWSCCNFGESTPKGFGYHIAWGETRTSKMEVYDGNYKYCEDDMDKLTKYCTQSKYGYNGFTDGLTELLPEDDAVTYYWGDQWRIPSAEQIEELDNNCSHEWIEEEMGMLVTGPNGGQIFLPATGYRNDYSWLAGRGEEGYYWSSSLDTENNQKAKILYFTFRKEEFGYNFIYFGLYSHTREEGLFVRPVRK